MLGALTAHDLLRGSLLGTLSFLGLPISVVLLATCAGALISQAATAAAAAGGPARARVLAVTGLLFLLQPVVRLAGRVLHGLTPWRRHGPRRRSPPCRGHAR